MRGTDQKVDTRGQQLGTAAAVAIGGSQREGKKMTAKEREGKIEKGYSPDTSLVRGVGALYVGR